MLKRAMVILTSLAAITGGAVMVAPAASAAGFGCAGSQIDVYPVADADNGAVLSNIFLYYDASTGKNGASNVRTSAGGAGTAARISVSVWADGGSAVTDNGIYSQYAGPVSVQAAGKCINVKAITYASGGRHGLVQRNGHCG
ncbi:hypothetical protein EDD95_1224 [Streptomyces sp. CEV 2-1]|uniref:hypothetical protein n=1 Tax=unclassified Streptomyces TaxID=2593676 RepID=UPI000F476554|nr:hypothetical protein [Streptomyces sp. CEV 2-1]ROQ81635.1 hypothetical protein EDD95_1224 [Streptomyces sp. CEV 2-1]